MKNLKKILILLLTLTLAFGLFACGDDGGDKPCTTCVDENEDGKCDVCKKDMPKDPVTSLLLIDQGYPDFQFVIAATGFPSSARDTLKNDVLKELNEKLEFDVEMVIENSKDDEEMEMEVLVGDVTSRGDDYKFDRHNLGKDGYVIKIVGKKIIINAGSDEALVLAIEEFADKILGIDEDEIGDVTMTSEDNIIEIQDDYDVTSLAVNGTDMKGYTIAADLDRSYYWTVAASIQDTLYDRTGYWLEIVKLSEATEKSIVIKHIDKVYSENSYRIYAAGSQLIVECAFDNMLEKATSEFLYAKITKGSGAVSFTGDVFKKDISVVYYEDFGAVGDGRTGTEHDDFKAIYETHAFANECGQIVKANRDNRENCTYYIFDTTITTPSGKKPLAAPIKTNVDWCGATFIIDDTKMHNYAGQTYYDMAHTDIFEVLPDAALTGYTITDPVQLASILGNGINPDTEYINLDCINWDGPVMIVPYNSGHKVFRRFSYSQHSGEAMHELIVVEADGKVSTETPIMFDYTGLSSVVVYKLDPATAITVENGTFITKESKVNHMSTDGTWKGGYIARGMNVMRSYTTVKNIEHVVNIGFTLDERAAGAEGPSNNGWFRAENANEVTFKDCIIPARIAYNQSSSYNLRGMLVNKLICDGCVQSNFWVTIDPTTHEIIDAVNYDKSAIGYCTKSSADALVGMGSTPDTLNLKVKYGSRKGAALRLCWGVGGTNYCKNMQYLNSSLSRIDAHAGLYNGAVINCNINDLELTGYGEFIMQDTNWYPYSASIPLLFLRSDYGYHWDGDILVKNVNAHVYDGSSLYLANHIYNNNWYFGYTPAFPNITVDNLDLYSMNTGDPLKKNTMIYISKFQNKDKYKHLLVNDPSDTEANKSDNLTAIFDIIDADGDGYVDEPLMDRNKDGKVDQNDLCDLDGDGKVGNTSLPYLDSYKGNPESVWDGIKIPGCTVNLNITKPPQYIKVINNDGVNETGGYRFIIKDTSGEGISDGGWYNTDETYGGFFGDTKFIYGEGENDFFYGTANTDPSGTFTFKAEEIK